MEQSNERAVFQVICGDDKLIKEVVKEFNRIYKTDFEILSFSYDEVIFAEILTNKLKLQDIFQLGVFYGSAIINKRQSNEIDW